MTASDPSIFLVKVTGQLETGQFIDGDELYFRYCYSYGQDWEVTRGIEEGISQTTRRSEDQRNIFVWNFPLDITFKSTNPFGWPQIVLSFNGSDFFGNDVGRGYASCHIPIAPGKYTKKLKTFVPESASTIQKFFSWLRGGRPEFVDPKTIAQGQGRELIRVRSQGIVTITFNVIFKDFSKLGFNCGHSSIPKKVDGILSTIIKNNESNGIKPVDYNQPSTSKVNDNSDVEED